APRYVSGRDNCPKDPRPLGLFRPFGSSAYSGFRLSGVGSLACKLDAAWSDMHRTHAQDLSTTLMAYRVGTNRVVIWSSTFSRYTAMLRSANCTTSLRPPWLRTFCSSTKRPN